jgi:hypothetical protein
VSIPKSPYLLPLGGFFVKIIEPPILLRVEVALKDNKSGQTHVESYPEIPEIDSGLRRADQYFWFTPSSRWDEDYTVTVTSRGVAFVARIDRAELAIASHLRFEEPFPDPVVAKNHCEVNALLSQHRRHFHSDEPATDSSGPFHFCDAISKLHYERPPLSKGFLARKMPKILTANTESR